MSAKPKPMRVVKASVGMSRRMIFNPTITPCPLHYTPLARDGTCPACEKLHPVLHPTKERP